MEPSNIHPVRESPTTTHDVSFDHISNGIETTTTSVHLNASLQKVPRTLHLEPDYIFSKKNKRRIKTPNQISELELFYREDKYPSDAMKLELGMKIGLTEKQISVWLCHRRLKDKKVVEENVHTNKRKDHSSGVIQDRGSGLWQDSCGSTKQGDHWQDPKEVESRRLYTDHVLNENEMNNNIRNSSSTSDTSSKTSSPFQEYPHTMETSTYSSCYGNSGLVKPVNIVKDRAGIRPSGYLKVKGEVENVAIIFVKRQLGSRYRKDGPPLGIEFQPLPPGAFGSPILNVDNGYHDFGNHVTSQSSNLYGARSQHISNKSQMHGMYNYRTSSFQSHAGERDTKFVDESSHQDHHFLPHKSSLSNRYNSSNTPKHSANISENYVDVFREKIPNFMNSNKYYENEKHGIKVEEFHGDTVNHINSPRVKLADNEQFLPQFQKYDYNQNTALGEQFDSKLNISRYDRCVDLEGQGGSSRRESL